MFLHQKRKEFALLISLFLLISLLDSDSREVTGKEGRDMGNMQQRSSARHKLGLRSMVGTLTSRPPGRLFALLIYAVLRTEKGRKQRKKL